MSNKDITCPNCEHTFSQSEAAWSVCLGCGAIAPPGENFGGGENELHPEPRGPGTDCFMGMRKYTEEEAKEKAAEVKQEKGIDE